MFSFILLNNCNYLISIIFYLITAIFYFVFILILNITNYIIVINIATF